MKESESSDKNAEISINKTVDYLFDSFNLNFDSKNINFFINAINCGATPIIVSNHQSLIDGIAIAKVVDQINNRVNSDKINGFYLPYAVSITTGDQNLEVVKYFSNIENRCRQRNLFLIPVIRKKDKEKYNIDEKSPLYINSQKSLRKILSLTKDKYGLAIFPEGTTQGGRIDHLGKFFGLFPSDVDSAIDSLIPHFIKSETDFCVLPIGINGSCRLFSPDTYQIQPINSKIEINIGDIMEPRSFKDNPKSSSNIVLKNIATNLLQPEYVGANFKNSSRTNLN